eukprot:jgi/Botrbrau1/8141/Bobra.0308s0031.1
MGFHQVAFLRRLPPPHRRPAPAGRPQDRLPSADRPHLDDAGGAGGGELAAGERPTHHRRPRAVHRSARQHLGDAALGFQLMSATYGDDQEAFVASMTGKQLPLKLVENLARLTVAGSLQDGLAGFILVWGHLLFGNRKLQELWAQSRGRIAKKLNVDPARLSADKILAFVKNPTVDVKMKVASSPREVGSSNAEATKGSGPDEDMPQEFGGMSALALLKRDGDKAQAAEKSSTDQGAKSTGRLDRKSQEVGRSPRTDSGDLETSRAEAQTSKPSGRKPGRVSRNERGTCEIDGRNTGHDSHEATASTKARGKKEGRACAECGTKGCAGGKLLECSGCRSVAYCGRDCQLKHWPSHKAACKAKQAQARGASSSNGKAG